MKIGSKANFISKLGKTRAGEHSRIWIEGQRLIAAGFIQGTKFEKDFDPIKRTLWLYAINENQFATTPHEMRGTVSGKDGKPIIDVVGQRVIDTFRSSHVAVAYADGLITITPAGDGA